MVARILGTGWRLGLRSGVLSQALLLGAVTLSIGWAAGCANNGDPSADEPTGGDGTPSTPHASSTTDADPSHPEFEAGFDDANVDPTPDGGDVCVDNGDPGSSENTAKGLPDTTDAQNDPIVVKGTLNGPVDIDFYSLKMADTFGHEIGVDLSDTTAATEMCVFVQCISGTTNFSKCDAGVETTSTIGDKGCCTSGPGKANPSWTCGGFTQTNDSAQLYIRIKQSGANACLPYSFSYAF